MTDTEQIRERIRSLTLPQELDPYLAERLPGILDGTGKINPLSLALVAEYTGVSTDWLLNGQVWSTYAGKAFHATLDCRGLRTGQDLWDHDCESGCGHKHAVLHTIRQKTMADALGSGKLPCAVCMPGSVAALLRSPCEEDFGHEPFEYNGHAFCRRCEIPDGPFITHTVAWPCTSAIVLGLVPRNLSTEEV